MAQQIEFYQIYYKQEQKSDLYDFAIPYYNDTLTPFFENAIISKLVKETQAEKIGIASHSLREKRSRMLPPRTELTFDLINSDYDVLVLTRNGREHNMLAIAEHWHKGFNEILQLVGEKISYRVPNSISYPVYQNHFIAKSELYKQYVEEFLDPAMHAMTEDVELFGLCWQNANYTRDILGRPIPMERIRKFLGCDYYPMHPFVCERFFSCWLEGRKLNVKYI